MLPSRDSRLWLPLREDQETLTPPGEVNGSGENTRLEETSTQIISSSSGSVIREDGTVKLAIIRPCVSRGARIRGLPPIYTPGMLEANHQVFAGWPMFMDHLTEEYDDLTEEELPAELAEALRRRARSVNELGGRIVRTEFDPNLRTEEDEEYGFQPGAVIGYALPQSKPKQMLEADPEILRVSINAYPTGAREASAPWDAGRKGMLIEGISKTPPGSVDWVIRAGAGGRVLRESARFAVSLMDRTYDPAAPSGDPKTQEEKMDPIEKQLKEMSADQVAVLLRESHPGLLEARAQDLIKEAGFITAADAAALVEESQTQVTTAVREALAERDAESARLAESMLTERETYKDLASYAHRLIEDADGLTPGWSRELKARYQVLPTGPTSPLLVESDDEASAEEKILESVKADVQHAVDLIRESAPQGTVTGQGTSGQEEKKSIKKGDNAFLDFMQESGGFKSPDAVITSMREAVQG
jgi:hypothetical protein